jgi:hypothetical protein
MHSVRNAWAKGSTAKVYRKLKAGTYSVCYRALNGIEISNEALPPQRPTSINDIIVVQSPRAVCAMRAVVEVT